MRIGFVGLGKMGFQIVSKLLAAGHEVVAFDINPDAVAAVVSQGAIAALDRQDLVAQLGRDPIVWLMIPADFVQSEVDAFCNYLPSGGVLVDGGNSDFRQTMQRANQCSASEIALVDVGTSGGIMGLTNGFSMMVGGDTTVVARLTPILDVLASPKGGHIHTGKTGSGHYVKMIHNGIEYAMMQAYAEGYDLLKYGPVPDIDLAAVADVWQKGSIISSTLNELTAEVLATNPELDGIDGFVAASGEGQWTYEISAASDIPTPALKAALDVRTASQNGKVYFATKLLAAMRHAFGGHPINKS